MDKKNSNISGFLDGYKAGNLSLMSSLFNLKKNEISAHIVNLMDNLSSDDSAESKRFLSEIRILKSVINYSLDSINAWLTFGESLYNVLNSFKKLPEKTQDLVLSDLKKIIYHFIDFAKKSEDQKLIDCAIEIGESF
jgi:hypothetical protein